MHQNSSAEPRNPGRFRNDLAMVALVSATSLGFLVMGGIGLKLFPFGWLNYGSLIFISWGTGGFWWCIGLLIRATLRRNNGAKVGKSNKANRAAGGKNNG